jgi:hypothetical protein
MPSEQSAPESGQASPHQAAARRTTGSGTSKVPPRLTSTPHLSAATNGGQWARVGPMCGGRGGGGGRLEEPTQARTWAAAAPSQVQQPAHQPSLDCQWHVLSLQMEYSGQPNARPRLRRSQSSSTVPRTRHTIRPAAPSLRLLGLDRMQPVARQRGSVQPGLLTGGTRLQHSACGCNTLCCAAASHLC